MQKGKFILKEKRQLTRDIYELKYEGETTAALRAGQFVNIEIESLYLRRPISVCDINESILTLIIKNIGAGTDKLTSANIGDTFDMLTCLGNGFDITKTGKNPVLLCGGVGVPPMYYLAKQLIKIGKKPKIAMGFSSKDDIFYKDEFENLGCEVLISTDDGSYGYHGFVTDMTAENLPECDYVFACGPEGMLKSAYNLIQFKSGQFSFESRMGCGFGACVCCSCKTMYGTKRICKDGPVLFKEEIIWE